MNVFVFFLVAALIGYLVASYGLFAYRISVGKQLAREAKAYSRDGGFNMSILVVGDSTAVGTGSTPEESVAGYLAEHFNAGVENHAVNGAQLKDATKQLDLARMSTYDFVIIHAGANDVIYGSTQDDVETYSAVVVEKAQALSERVVVISSGDIGEAPIWPFPLDRIFTKRTKAVRSIIKPTVEEKGAAYIDLLALDTPFASDPKRYYAPDLLHLSGEGYRVWFEAMREAIENKWSEYGERNS